MNELIKQFKQQAGVDFNPDQEGLDLFARLIVEECIGAFECANGIRSEISSYGMSLLVEDVKKHFGVE